MADFYSWKSKSFVPLLLTPRASSLRLTGGPQRQVFVAGVAGSKVGDLEINEPAFNMWGV